MTAVVALLWPHPHPQAQAGKQPDFFGPQLTGITRLSDDAENDRHPTIAFSRFVQRGLVVWGKGPTCYTGYHTMWTGTWSGVAPIPSQPSLRNYMYSPAFSPSSDSFWLTYGSNNGPCTADTVKVREWNGSWSSTETELGDAENDNDFNGSARYAADGSHAVLVWVDGNHFSLPEQRGIQVNVWNGTWGSALEIQPQDLINNLAHNRCLAQDPVSGLWAIAYVKQPTDVHVESQSSEVAYQLGSVSGGTWSVATGQTLLTSDDLHDSIPVVGFRDSGEGAILWSRRIGNGDREIVASFWISQLGQFGPMVQLTDNAFDDQVHDIIPAANGWHVLFTREVLGQSEIYYGWLSGSALSRVRRLTNNTVVEGQLLNGHRATGLDGDLTSTGRLMITWIQWDGVDSSTKEIYLAEVQLL